MNPPSDRHPPARPPARQERDLAPEASGLPEARNGTVGAKAGLNLEQSRAIGQDSPLEGSRQGREHLREIQGGPAAESSADRSALTGLPPEGDFQDGNSERNSRTNEERSGRGKARRD